LNPNQWKQIFELYHATLELPETDRAAFLRTCTTDEDVRREVTSLLENDKEGEALLPSPALEVAARMMANENDLDSKRNSGPMIGKTVLHYRIVGKIGQGGMGEVYQAKDQKLGRDVAIKVLPEEFARDADRVARFQREAKLLASLNHTNIAAIYGLEKSNETNFLVLELVEGQTLADMIKAGPIPTEESLKMAVQIAEALEAAHEKGVIHRDLKPANIKVTPEGKVKVLDFGLAKAFAGEQAELNLSNSPTLTYAATQKGIILGTAAYMSPEQARGKAVDKRTDIWAFGCVLYEMLTGRTAFQGEDISDILASVIKGEVKIDTLAPNIHSRVREVLTRCLQKDVRKRYSGITDVLYEIEQALVDSEGESIQSKTPSEPGPKWRPRLWFAVGIILTAIIAGVVVWKLKPTSLSESRHVIRFEYQLPEGQEFSPESYLIYNPGSLLAASPDGRQFAYATPNGIYLRSLDESTSRLIAGTEGRTRQPFFSPDGKWIGYYSAADSKLKKIATTGGIPVALCDVQQFLGASWSEDKTIVYGQDPGGIMKISENGGRAENLIIAKSYVLESPQVLPDGKSILYTALANPNNAGSARIMVEPIGQGTPKELVAGHGAHYLPTGHIVYRRGNAIYAIAFDLGRLSVTGGTIGVVEKAGSFAISDSGMLVYKTQQLANSGEPLGNSLVWVDRAGKEESIAVPAGVYGSPKISPDGTRVALSVWDSRSTMSIWIWDLARTTMSRLTSGEKQDMQSIWTPDTKRIFFSSSLTGTNALAWKAADGTGEIEKLASIPGRLLLPWSISSDGKSLLMEESIGTRFGISIMSMEGNRAVKPLLHHENWDERQPEISPNGKWLVYSSNESGRYEVYARPSPDVDKNRWQVSAGGGSCPLWAPTGRELFYLNYDNSVIATAVETEPKFSLGTPKTLFRSATSGIGGANIGQPWDISPDGRRFLMIKPIPPASGAAAAIASQKINIVINWLEELRQRVPAK
jgi:eukaryotic-like serine/threonine-protein kinase